MDGALDYVDQLLDWAYASGLTVLFDIHAMKGSQNGFDNSGQAMGFQWTTKLNTEPANLVTFEHWPIRTAEWMGQFDLDSTSYPEINHDNLKHSLEVIEILVKTYSGHPAVLGLEPVIEPWQYTPIDQLKKFYSHRYLLDPKAQSLLLNSANDHDEHSLLVTKNWLRTHASVFTESVRQVK